MGREDYSKVQEMVVPAFDWHVDMPEMENAFGEKRGEKIFDSWKKRLKSELDIVANPEWPYDIDEISSASDFSRVLNILSETIRDNGGNDVLFMDAEFKVVDNLGKVVDFGTPVTDRWVVGPKGCACINDMDSPAPGNPIYALRRALREAIDDECADELQKDMIDHVVADIDASMRQRERM